MTSEVLHVNRPIEVGVPLGLVYPKIYIDIQYQTKSYPLCVCVCGECNLASKVFHVNRHIEVGVPLGLVYPNVYIDT